MGIRNNRYDADCPTVTGAAQAPQVRARARGAHRPRRHRAQAQVHPARPDDADRHAGRRLLRRPREDGLRLRRAAEPGSQGPREARRRRRPVRRARLQRLPQRDGRLGRAGAGEGGRGPEVHDRRAHLLRLRHRGQQQVEGDAGRELASVRADLPGARPQQDPAGLARSPRQPRAARADEAAQDQDRAGRRHRRRVRQDRDAGGSGRDAEARDQVRRPRAHPGLHQLRHGADDARRRLRQAARAGRGRGAGAEGFAHSFHVLARFAAAARRAIPAPAWARARRD